MFDAMANALARGERIEIRGFGSFGVKQRRARQGRNPSTGDMVSVEAKRIPFFRAGKELRIEAKWRRSRTPKRRARREARSAGGCRLWAPLALRRTWREPTCDREPKRVHLLFRHARRA